VRETTYICPVPTEDDVAAEAMMVMKREWISHLQVGMEIGTC
jgi:hypothetical protein